MEKLSIDLMGAGLSALRGLRKGTGLVGSTAGRLARTPQMAKAYSAARPQGIGSALLAGAKEFTPMAGIRKIPMDPLSTAFTLHSGYEGYREGGLETALQRGLATGLSMQAMLRGGEMMTKGLQKGMARRGMFQKKGPSIIDKGVAAWKGVPISKHVYNKTTMPGRALSFGVGDVLLGSAAGLGAEALSKKYINPIGNIRKDMQREQAGLHALRQRSPDESVY